jgi:hypothetical protein
VESGNCSGYRGALTLRLLVSMNPHPDPPLLAVALGVGCAGVSYFCHRVRQALHNNKLIPLNMREKGVKRTGVMNLRRTWPFRDEYQKTVYTRSIFDIIFFGWKWVTGCIAFMLVVIYPVVYLIQFAK